MSINRWLSLAGNVSFEWWVASQNGNYGTWKYLVTFQEAYPGSVIYDYYFVANSAPNIEVIGAQSYGTQKSTQYSFFNNPNVRSGMRLVYDPVSNTFSQSGSACSLIVKMRLFYFSFCNIFISLLHSFPNIQPYGIGLSN